MRHTLLLVDDEENILRALVRLFHKSGHEVITAPNGEQGLQILRNKEVSLIISDQRMPGMSGTQFLFEARNIQPEAVRIILTGYSDLQSAMDAINTGQVYRFLAKPWDDEVLLDTVAEALANLDLKRENFQLQRMVVAQNIQLKELNADLEDKVAERTAELYETVNKLQLLNASLKEQNAGIIRCYASLIDLRSQPLGDHSRRVGRLVKPVCQALGLTDTKELQQFTIAALLHDIGKVGLPDSTLGKDYAQLFGEELQEVKKHPVIGQGELQVLSEFLPASLCIRNHHENFDGSGYPDGLAGQQIPLGARIIRVLDSYDRALYKKGIVHKPLNVELIDGMYKERGKKYDYEVIRALIEVLKVPADHFERRGEVKLAMSELISGMVLSRDIRTSNGVLVLAADEDLQDGHIEKLKNYSKIYAIDQPVYVYEGDAKF